MIGRLLRALRLLLVLGLPLLAVCPSARAADDQQAGFDALLRAHVRDGVVDYPGIAGDARLAPYVAALAAPQRSAGAPERLALLINAYNALAIQGILDGLSPATLFGRYRYFKSKSWRFDGREIDLYDLEHELIRPLGEPRIHFAIVCASRSCPKLRGEAFSPDRLEAQLEEAARQFVNDPARNRFDKTSRTAYLSEIFEWFAEDFDQAAGSVPGYVARYVADPEVARGLAAGEYTLRYLDYDWNLNGIAPWSGW